MASFFKFLSNPNFSSQLMLPPQFVKEYGEELSEEVEIFTETGGSWTVKTEQIGSHRYLTEGWPRFAEEAGLKDMEFLVFRLVGKSRFEVWVFDETACPKDLRSMDNEEDVKVDEEDANGDGRIWKFVKKLTEEHTSELEIPRDFAEAIGIEANGKLKLRLGPRGYYWSIHVTPRKLGKLVMRVGWNEFLTANNVLIGSTISFTFVGGSGNVIEAKVEKNEGDDGNRESFGPTKRSRGRPPKFDA